MIQRIYIPLKTSSCGMFLRIHPKKHEARSAVIDLSLGSSKNVFENSFEETTSVERSRRKNHGVSRHTKKTQKVVGLCDFLFKPLAEDWRGVGEWSEVLLRTRRIRWM